MAPVTYDENKMGVEMIDHYEADEKTIGEPPEAVSHNESAYIRKMVCHDDC